MLLGGQPEREREGYEGTRGERGRVGREREGRLEGKEREGWKGEREGRMGGREREGWEGVRERDGRIETWVKKSHIKFYIFVL